MQTVNETQAITAIMFLFMLAGAIGGYEKGAINASLTFLVSIIPLFFMRRIISMLPKDINGWAGLIQGLMFQEEGAQQFMLQILLVAVAMVAVKVFLSMMINSTPLNLMSGHFPMKVVGAAAGWFLTLMTIWAYLGFAEAIARDYPFFDTVLSSLMENGFLYHLRMANPLKSLFG